MMSLLRLALIAGCLPLSRGDDIPKFKVGDCYVIVMITVIAHCAIRFIRFKLAIVAMAQERLPVKSESLVTMKEFTSSLRYKMKLSLSEWQHSATGEKTLNCSTSESLALCNVFQLVPIFCRGSPSASGFLGGRLTEALTPAGGWTNAIEEWKIPKKLCKGLIKTIYQKECGGDHHRGRRRVCPSCGQRELCFVERICEIAYDIHTSLESDKMIERVTSV